MTVMIMGTLAGVIGIALAWNFYVRQPASASILAARLPQAYDWSLHKFYIDEFYNRYVVGPILGLARAASSFDNWGVDRLVDWLGGLPAIVGGWFRRWQTGLVQHYAAIMFMGVTLMAALILFLR
jgi:NADH:ubiquinone oxidoreductase subunit 5 (subunit L)/multisubunit Na+/H+ antiporter MnhA subunit